MKIKFPRDVEIDIDNIPDDFDEIIRNSFKEFTYGTKKEYAYEDKLRWIDLCRMYLHKAEDTGDCVLNLMKDMLDYEVSEFGNVPDKEDYLSIEFMEQCFKAGRTDLHAFYTKDNHKNEKILQLLARAITVVMDYEG